MASDNHGKERGLLASATALVFLSGYCMNISAAYAMVPGVCCVLTGLAAADFLIRRTQPGYDGSASKSRLSLLLVVSFVVSALTAAGAAIAYVMHFQHYITHVDGRAGPPLNEQQAVDHLRLCTVDHFAFWTCAHLAAVCAAGWFMVRGLSRNTGFAPVDDAEEAGAVAARLNDAASLFKLDFLLAACTAMQVIVGHILILSTDTSGIGAAWLCGITSAVAGWISLICVVRPGSLQSGSTLRWVAMLCNAIASLSGLFCMGAFQGCRYKIWMQSAYPENDDDDTLPALCDTFIGSESLESVHQAKFAPSGADVFFFGWNTSEYIHLMFQIPFIVGALASAGWYAAGAVKVSRNAH
jgi:hypothetical protein